jgi:hypothetical protein
LLHPADTYVSTTPTPTGSQFPASEKKVDHRCYRQRPACRDTSKPVRTGKHINKILDDLDIVLTTHERSICTRIDIKVVLRRQVDDPLLVPDPLWRSILSD